MQILGKRSKILLITVVIVMLVALGTSFAMWDKSAVKATNGNLSDYANAKVGDIITFGRYYQTGEKDPNDSSEYEKTPIEWLVVDKDERTGQLTLMSKYILACGSYFGNYYDDGTGYAWHYNNKSATEVGGLTYNSAYVDSTIRAFLNNLERLDMGGDSFSDENGYIPSATDSTRDLYDKDSGHFQKGTGLLSSLGFSNKKYWTDLKLNNGNVNNLIADRSSGLYQREGSSDIYYQRPISNYEYKSRPMTRGFYDEAFNSKEKSIIVPKVIAGYTGHRWPDSNYNIDTMHYIEGVMDKVWLPSATELNVMNGLDWNIQGNDNWTNPSDEAGSTVFEYFKGLSEYELAEKLIADRTSIANNGMIGNYSIPIYKKETTEALTEISTTNNTSSSYWTRSPSSIWYNQVRIVENTGYFSAWYTHNSNFGVRPCVILKY